MLFNNPITIAPTLPIAPSWSFILSVKPKNDQGTISRRDETTIWLNLLTNSQDKDRRFKNIVLRLPCDGSMVNFENVNLNSSNTPVKQ